MRAAITDQRWGTRPGHFSTGIEPLPAWRFPQGGTICIAATRGTIGGSSAPRALSVVPNPPTADALYLLEVGFLHIGEFAPNRFALHELIGDLQIAAVSDTRDLWVRVGGHRVLDSMNWGGSLVAWTTPDLLPSGQALAVARTLSLSLSRADANPAPAHHPTAWVVAA